MKRMLPYIIYVIWAVLFQSDHGGNFRKKDGNDTLVLPQNALCVLAAQQLAKFNLNPFFGDLMQQVFAGTLHRPSSFRW